MHIGLRLPPNADLPGLVNFLSSSAGDGELEIHGVQEGVRSTKQTPLVPPFLRAIRGHGGTPRFTVKLGTSDMTVVGPVWQCPILAYGPGDATYEVEVGYDDGELTASVRDHGIWRDKRGEHRGRGLGIIQRLMDDVAVEADGEGTLVRMRRRLRQEQAA